MINSNATDLGDALVRPGLRALVPYESARRIGGSGEVWLNANENPYGRELTISAERWHRYPDFQPPAVIEGYARYAGVAPEQLLISRGADEAIELLIRTFCEPGVDNVIYCPPTYGMYNISSKTNLVALTEVPLDSDFQPDVAAILAAAADAKLLFLCSPNNPTGHLLERARLLALLDALAGKTLVVVDEAYIEFAMDATVVPLLAQYPHLVITRTLSKAFGLAGIRCGFTIAAPEVIGQLAKVIAPYPVPVPVAQIAAEALSAEGLARMAEQVSLLNSLRADFVSAMAALPNVKVWASHGNFVLLQVPDNLACMAAAAQAGIILRDQSKQKALPRCVRVTIGSEEEMLRTVNALENYLRSAG